MNVAVEDLKVVIDAAKAVGGKVVLGGHSLGGSVVTAYATWDFGGEPGAQELSGLVYDDGGSSPEAISKEDAETSLATLEKPAETPWLAFGGIVAPDLGLFSAVGSALTIVEPKGPSQLEPFAGLPPDLRSPIAPVTNEAGFGYSVNVGTSPESLAAAQIHGGAGVEEAEEADHLHGWNGTGALTPVSRYAEMLSGMVSGTTLRESGSEWYFPSRLTLDTGAVGNGLANKAQEVLNLHSTMGEHLPKSLHILAIDSELDKLFGGEQTTLTEAKLLAEQSGISTEECSALTTEGCVTLIEEKNSYAHNDPAGATPEINEFFKHMVPFLKEIAN
jgi:pimeloyl-ACP methyl ester carboxylesterase